LRPGLSFYLGVAGAFYYRSDFPPVPHGYPLGPSLSKSFVRQVIGLVLVPERNRGDQLLSYFQEMSNKAQRVAGIFIAPLLMLAGLWLRLDGLERGGSSGIFAIGPFVAVAGALWFVSDWFE
jgi:hypothetical protein